MRKYEEFYYEAVSTPFEFPPLKLSTMACQCHYCKAVTHIPVPTEFTDWKRVSEDYRKAYEAMSQNFQELFKEAGRVFDAPLKEWLDAKHAHLTMQLENLLEEFRKSKP